MKKIFKILTNIGNKLLKFSNSRVLDVILAVSMVCILIICWLIWEKEMLFLQPILVISGITFYAMLIAFMSQKYLVSVTSFLGIGFVYYLVIILAINLLIHTGSQNVNIVICYIAAALLWWFYSLIANNKVASTANEILSAIFGILILIKDTYIAMMPDSILELKDNLGYTYEKSIEMISGIIFSPLLAINIIALLLCVLKGYWIEKYNDNQDVGYEYTEHKEIEDTEN